MEPEKEKGAKDEGGAGADAPGKDGGAKADAVPPPGVSHSYPVAVAGVIRISCPSDMSSTTPFRGAAALWKGVRCAAASLAFLLIFQVLPFRPRPPR